MAGLLYEGTVAATTTAAPLTSTATDVTEVGVQNDPDSADDILVGNVGGQHTSVPPGGAVVIPAGNLSEVYVKTEATTATVNYLAHNSQFGRLVLNPVAQTAAKLLKCATVALAAVDTGGGVFSWQNPEPNPIVVDHVLIDVTTVSSGACTIDVGETPTSATTSSATIIDGLDVHTAAGIFTTVDSADSGMRQASHVPTGAWITASKATGASAALVGFAYIFYVTA